MTKNSYYDVRDDFKKYPLGMYWLYIVMSKRGPGKTYSALRYMIEEKKMFIFIKRTIDDVKNLCANDGVEGKLDFSPFKPLNRDFGWDIHPKLIQKGVAGFYDCSGETKELVGYCIAANVGTKYKGADISEADFIIFDEFIPNPWEHFNRKTEGRMVLDFYMTVKRDREKRGRPPLVLLMLANAVEVNCPMLSILELVDIVADMDVTDTEYRNDAKKGYMIHIINSEFDKDEDYEPQGIEVMMEGTAWAAATFGAHFAYNDFSAIGRQKLKGYKCLYSFRYQQRDYYVWRKADTYFIGRVKGETYTSYDLNRENQQKLFWEEEAFYLRQSAIEDKVVFGDYTSYNLITNYRKEFDI